MRDETGKFLPGNEGRPPGAVNAFTSLKQDLLEAYRAEAAKEKGGVAFLRSVKRRYPGLFLRVLSRLLPRELTVDMGQTPHQMWRELQEITAEMDAMTIPGPPGGDGGSRPRLPRMGRSEPDVPGDDDGNGGTSRL